MRLARWVLLAIALDGNRIAEAIGEARAMTAPVQYLQEKPVNTALETAVLLWNKGDSAAAQEMLTRAVQLAEESHYL